MIDWQDKYLPLNKKVMKNSTAGKLVFAYFMITYIGLIIALGYKLYTCG